MDPDRVSVVYDIRRKLRKGFSEDVFSQFVTLGSYSGAAALLIFLLHVTMARLLGPEDYAGYGAYVAVLFTALFCLTSIHLVVSRFIAYHRSRFQYEQINYIITRALKIVFPAGFIVFGITSLLADSISLFFNMHSIAPTIMLGFVLWFTMMVPVFEGAFKGLEDYHHLGIFRITESSTRFVAVLVLVLMGFGVSGAIFGLGLGTFIALALTYHHIHKIMKLKMMKPDAGQIRKFSIPVVVTMVSLALLLNMDIILVKHWFPAAEAGVFAAASLIAKIPFFISMVFVGVMFPKITYLHADGKNSVPVLKHGLQVVVPVVAVFTLLSFFFTKPFLRAIFGPEYVIGSSLGFYVFGMGLLAITTVLLIYLLGVQRDRMTKFLPFFVLGLWALLLALHGSILEIMIVVMFVMSALAAFAVYQSRDVIEFDYFL